MSRPPKPVNPEKRPIDRPEHIRKVRNLRQRLDLVVTASLLASGGATTEAEVNVVTLIGNLATDVDVRDVGPDKKVASFVLAVDRVGRDGGADFVSVSAWDRQAELCAEYLGKGRRVALDGRLRSRSWEEEGKRRSAIEVVARRIEFLGGGPRSSDRDGGGADVISFEAPAAAG
jgi:single-strand DNA-binding protein